MIWRDFSVGNFQLHDSHIECIAEEITVTLTTRPHSLVLFRLRGVGFFSYMLPPDIFIKSSEPASPSSSIGESTWPQVEPR